MQRLGIWSYGKNEFVTVEMTDEVYRALLQFGHDRAEDGKMFSSMDVAEICTSELLEKTGTGVAAMLAPFVPDGYGVTQHKHDSFAIETRIDTTE